MDLEKLEQDIWENILGGCQLDSDERQDNYRGIIGCSFSSVKHTIEILEKCLHPNNEDGAYTNIVEELKVLNAQLSELKAKSEA